MVVGHRGGGAQEVGRAVWDEIAQCTLPSHPHTIRIPNGHERR